MKLAILFLMMQSLGGLVDEKIAFTERIDRYDYQTSTYVGTLFTMFDEDSTRLKMLDLKAIGDTALLAYFLYDEEGRQKEMIYFEDGSLFPGREFFKYSRDGRSMTTTYLNEEGVPDYGSVVNFFDVKGNIKEKRYFRMDGSQYGEEDVFWASDGKQLGWEYRSKSGKGRARFDYAYLDFDEKDRWVRRTYSRDNILERMEVRTIIPKDSTVFLNELRIASNLISTHDSETSPSFSVNGKTMVFARYDDWDSKTPYIAYNQYGGWEVSQLDIEGYIYNLSITPDGNHIFFTRAYEDRRVIYVMDKIETGWSQPENLSEKYIIKGSYISALNRDRIYVYDFDGDQGEGIYEIIMGGEMSVVVPKYIPLNGTAFDAFTRDGTNFYISRCFDEECGSNDMNGIWFFRQEGDQPIEQRKLDSLPYVWGIQPVPALGLMVYTDGEDILAIPLRSVE